MTKIIKGAVFCGFQEYLIDDSQTLAEFTLMSIILLDNICMKVTSKLNQKRNLEESASPIKPTFFQMKTYEHDGILEQLAFMLIRPPRFVYNPDILTPSRKHALRFTTETYQLPFQLTLYRQNPMRYVILYLHGNGSSRFEGYLFLNSLPDGVGLACFDFSGCGNRYDSEYITLGQNEAKDVDIAAHFLKQKGFKVVGWGRSMGAVSLLRSSECQIAIADSAYSHLPSLCKESSSKFLPKACCCIFHCFFPCVFACIKCKVNNLSGLEISRMDVSSDVSKNNRRQICFLHGQQDTLIASHHAQALYDSFPGRKMLIYFDGTHNSSRPNEVLRRCFQFIDQALVTDTPSGIIPENNKLSAMELRTLEEGVIDKGQRISEGTEILAVTPNKMDAEISHSYAKFHAEYSNGLPSTSKNVKQLKQEQYCEAGEKLDPSFCGVIGKDDFQSFPGDKQRQQIVEKLFERKT